MVLSCRTRSSRCSFSRLDRLTPAQAARVLDVTPQGISQRVSSEVVKIRAVLSRPGHVLPVVKPHVAGDYRPFPHLRPHPGDVVRGADSDAGNVLVEPRPHLVPHDTHSLLIVGLG